MSTVIVTGYKAVNPPVSGERISSEMNKSGNAKSQMAFRLFRAIARGDEGPFFYSLATENTLCWLFVRIQLLKKERCVLYVEFHKQHCPRR